MSAASNYLILAAPIGIGATAFMDLVAVVRKRLFNSPMPDYGMVGRWLAYLPRGRFLHHPVSASAPVPRERLIGWSAHYLIGIAFAALLLFIGGIGWICRPTLAPALLVGIATVAAPFLVMQPGMGAGLASSRAPNPKAARIRSLVAHGTFGLGLYLAGWATSLLGTPAVRNFC
jgi:hypothetical protein